MVKLFKILKSLNAAKAEKVKKESVFRHEDLQLPSHGKKNPLVEKRPPQTCRRESWQNVSKPRNTTQSADDCSRKSFMAYFYLSLVKQQ